MSTLTGATAPEKLQNVPRWGVRNVGRGQYSTCLNVYSVQVLVVTHRPQNKNFIFLLAKLELRKRWNRQELEQLCGKMKKTNQPSSLRTFPLFVGVSRPAPLFQGSCLGFVTLARDD